MQLRSSARAAHGGKLSYRWTLISRPRGSRARLRGARSARPLLIPDRPGHYLVRQSVTEGGTGAGSASVDQVALTASAQPALLALSTNSEGYDPRGIQIGNSYYHHDGPGATIQWLMLDRATLQPVKTGNSWCCDNGAHSLQNLSSVLGCSGGTGSAGLDQLLIITIPPNRVTLTPDQYGEFNSALQAIGVNPLPTALLNDPSQSLTIVGIPCAGAGSGWVLRRGGGPARVPQQAWLMYDGSTNTATNALLYRFQPQRLAFNTRAASSANTNRMTFAGQSASVSITPGEGGFQVVEIDPRDLSIAANNAYAVTSNNPGPAVNAMAAELNAARQRGNYVAVQSIGSVRPDYYQWADISEALVPMGANPDLFNRINGGSYAFFGGPPLAASEVMQSASTVVIDPTTSPPTTEPGALSGRARQRPDGFYVPIAATPPALGQSLYDIVFKPSTPWPYTAAAGDPNAPAYQQALAYITSQLPDLKKWGPDLRQAYVANTTLDYSESKTDLQAVKYPGDGRTCTQNPGKNPSNPGYTRIEFCKLAAELQNEFDWLDSTRTLFRSYETAMGRSGAQQGADLRTAGQQISKAVDPQRSGLAAPILYLLQSIAEVGAEFLGSPDIAPEIGLIATTYDLGSAAATNDDAPVSQQISGRVDQLADDIATNVANSANALDGVRAVAISDYGRLKALAAVATAAQNVDITDLAKKLTTGADAYFATQLMPLGFYMWRLEPNSSNQDPQPGNCLLVGYINPPFQNIQNSAWQHVYRSYDGFRNYQSLILNDSYYRAGYPPPQALTHTMFSPPLARRIRHREVVVVLGFPEHDQRAQLRLGLNPKIRQSVVLVRLRSEPRRPVPRRSLDSR